MRIAIVTHQFPPSIGGMQQWNHQMARAYALAGHSVDVYHFKLGQKEHSDPLYAYHGIVVDPEVDVEKCGKHTYTPWFLLQCIYRAIKLIPRLYKVDVVQVCFGEPVVLKLLIFVFSFFCRFKILMVSGCVIFRHPYKNALTKKAMFALSRMLIRRSRMMLVDGIDIKKEILEQGVSNVPIHVCYAGIDCTLFAPSAKATNLAVFARENNLPIPSQNPTILYCARFSYENDPLAFVNIVRNMEHVSPIMIGDGPLMPDVLQAAKNTINPICFWGSMPYTLLPQIYSSVAICCYPYTRFIGGISQVIPLSMACGALVITTNIGDNNSLIQHGVNGFLVKEGDLQGMQVLIEKILFGSLKEQANTIRIAARRTICDNWSLAARDEMYGEILRGIGLRI